MPTTSTFAIDVPASLLARARSGERAAFEQLYRRFERPVFNLALRICGDRLAEALPGDDLLPDDLAPPPAAAADAAALQRALAALPAATRSVLWLYHAEGYTHEEIATLMARTPSFSKSQLARGGRRLRALLEPESLIPAPLAEAAPA